MFSEKLKSRKLWVAILSQILLMLADALGFHLSLETIVSFVTVAVGYIAGQSHVDAIKIKAESIAKNK